MTKGDGEMKAWHFTDGDKLRYNDDRIPEIGVTLECEGKPDLCIHGMHGSKSIIDALGYAPGLIAWEVSLSGEMDIGSDKISAKKRKPLARHDLTPIIGEFAEWCAKRAKKHAHAAHAASAARVAERKKQEKKLLNLMGVK